MACAPVEQAVTTAWFGPFRPCWIETWPAARLISRPGMKKGEMRRGPFSRRVMRGILDALQAADAGADQDAGGVLVVGSPGLPAGVVERLRRGGHRVDDEVVDLALLLGLHPVVGVEGAVGAVAARHLAGDLGRQVVDLEAVDLRRAALAGEDVRPGRLDTGAERRDHAETGDDDAPH